VENNNGAPKRLQREIGKKANRSEAEAERESLPAKIAGTSCLRRQKY